MSDEPKRLAADHAVRMVAHNQIVGLGTGSTTRFAIEGLGRLLRDGLQIRGVATSVATSKMAADLGIPLLDLNDIERIDITIDGADEIDEKFNMIKGGGGALTREKLVALSSVRRVIIVDETKLVARLGSTRVLPVEVLPFSWARSVRLLKELGGNAQLRRDGDAPFLTDNGNYILDCRFDPIEDPPMLERQIKLLPGVVESGLFISIADTVVVGFENRVEVRERK
jgi:ribose 5-phosphate isomerase A